MSRDSYRDACLQAVDDEPELPGDMPDAMWAALRLLVEGNDRVGMIEALRITVRQTKIGIRERIEDITQSSGPSNPTLIAQCRAALAPATSPAAEHLADQLDQEADEITCYASTVTEHRPNRTASLLREAAKVIRLNVTYPAGPECSHEWVFHVENYGADRDGNRGVEQRFYECQKCGECTNNPSPATTRPISEEKT